MGAPSSRVCCHSRWAIATGSMPADLHHADLVAVPVNGPMVGAAERNGEFIADPAPHGSRLHEPQMVSVRRLPSAQKARLRRHELQMGAIAIAARFAEGKGALVDMPEDGVVHRRCLRRHEAARKAEAVQTAAPAQDAAACACACPQGGALPWRRRSPRWRAGRP